MKCAQTQPLSRREGKHNGSSSTFTKVDSAAVAATTSRAFDTMMDATEHARNETCEIDDDLCARASWEKITRARGEKQKKNEIKHSYSSLARSLVAWHFDNNKLFNNSTIVPTVSPHRFCFAPQNGGSVKLVLFPRSKPFHLESG